MMDTNRMISRIPVQNTGAAKPNRDRKVTVRLRAPLGFRAAMTPSRVPTMIARICAEKTSSRRRRHALEHQRRDRGVEEVGVAEVEWATRDR